MSFQLKGTPVAIGVVNRLDRVMMILCASPLASLTERKPGAARLVDDDQRLLHQLVLDDDALDQARHLVGTAAGAGGHDELDRFAGLPRGQRRAGHRQYRCGDRCAEREFSKLHFLVSCERIWGQMTVASSGASVVMFNAA
jgi:hypothetical protein